MRPLKILHLTTHLNIGGISRYILMAAGRMAREGHEVWVLSSGGEWLPQFHAAGIRTIEFPIRTKNEFHPKLFWLLPGIVRWAKKEKFDILHAHTRVTKVMADLLSKLTGIPYVTTAHGFYKRRLSRRLFDAWGRRVVAISLRVSEDLRENHRLKPERIRMVRNGIDIQAFQKSFSGKNPHEIKTSLGLPEKSRVLTSVGRLVKDKGHSFLIEALALLKPQFPDLYVVIVGEGREHASLEALAKKTGVFDRLRIIPKADIPAILSITDIFVHPVNYREGFGLSILEALAVARPVLITRLCALSFLIRDLSNGFVVEEASAQALADKISWMLGHPDVMSRVAVAGQKTAVEFGSLDRQVRELLDVYAEVVL